MCFIALNVLIKILEDFSILEPNNHYVRVRGAQGLE